jgi:PAS domain S-box-containing protein
MTISPVHDKAGHVADASAITRDNSDRNVAKTKRPGTHRQTRQVLERITDGFYALDQDWCFTYINRAAERLLGRTRKELLHKNIWDEFPPTVGTPLYAAYHEAVDGETTTTVEFYYPPFEAWFDVRAYPSPDGLSVFFREVTASRQLDETLRASEEKYRTLVEQLPAVIYILATDEHQTPLYYSPRFEELTGFSAADAMARTDHWLESVHPDDRARVAAEEARTAVSNEPFRAEYRHVRKDGSYVWVQDECVAVRDESGRVVAWQGMLLDITERVQIEEDQLRLAAVVTSSSEAIMSTTLDGIITSWNPAAERLYGYSTAEAVGQSVIMLTPPGMSSDVTGLLARVQRGESVEGYETIRLTKDGRRINISLAISPVRDASGNVVAVSSVARDITQLRRLQEERDRLYAELDAEFQRAAEIQAQMLPHVAPNVVGYEFAGVCLPARQVGGDFFDWTTDQTSVHLSLGDVMGKGMPASLLMATVRAALRSVTHLSVSAAVEAVNRALTPDLAQSDSFITLFYANLDIGSGTLSYIDAGHGMAFVQRCDGGVEPLLQRGLPLGVLPDATFTEGMTRLEPGDTLVLYSDGLPDSRPELRLDPVGVAEQFGELKDAQAKLEKLVSMVVDVETRPDDLTLLLVRRQEEPSPVSGGSLTRGNPSR